MLTKSALLLQDYQDDPGSKLAMVSINCVKILINVCSLSGTRVYIPGETHIAA